MRWYTRRAYLSGAIEMQCAESSESDKVEPPDQ